MKQKSVFATIILLLVLTACAGAQMPGISKTKEQQAYKSEYRTGTEGLRISFIENLPPPRLFDTEQFTAVLQIENKGAFTVGGPGDKIYLSGFDPTIITGISQWGMDIPPLEGKNQFVPEGVVDTVEFRGTIAPLKAKNINKYPVKLVATACYGYETTSTANVCIDPNPQALNVRKVCTPTQVSLGGGQGAPVSVNLVEVEASPGKTRFKINVQNIGGGDVFRSGTDYLARCSPFGQPLSFEAIDYVELVEVIVSGISIKQTCKPLDDNHIRLTNGKGVVFCEFATRGQDAYTTPIAITLRYGYRNSIFKEFQIVSAY
ncbi:MAG: hypothetical protein QW666_00680 [Candidatus Woesearchaeota archaeon]